MNEQLRKNSPNSLTYSTPWAGYSQSMVPAEVLATAEPGRPIRHLQVLWSRKWILVAFLFAGILTGGALVWRQPYVYRARAVLEAQGLNDNLLNRREVDPNAARDNSSQNYINTQARILQSGPLLDAAAARLNREGAWAPRIRRAEIAAGLRVSTHDGNRILEAEVESGDAKRAAAIANAVAGELIDQEVNSRWEASKRTTRWLSTELEELGRKVKDSEEALQTYMHKEDLIVQGDEGGADDAALMHMEQELARAKADRIGKAAAYEVAKTSSPGGSSAPDNELQAYQIQLTTLRRDLAQLEATYTPTFYKIQPVKDQIAAVEAAYNHRRQELVSQMANDYKAAFGRESMLQQHYLSLRNQASARAGKMLQYNALKRELDLNQSIYGEMLQKVKGYSVASAMQPSNIRMVDPAEPPLRPNRPNKVLLTLLTGFGFLAVGFVLCLAKSAGDQRIAGPGESQFYLQSPELGVIPSAKSDEYYRHERRIKPRDRQAAALSPGRSNPVETITWFHAPSRMAESFRAACASLMLPQAENPKRQVLLVTSLSPGEGKTTVAANLGIALAGVAGSVLLIDADRRRPRLHSVWNLPNDYGLSEILSADARAGEIRPADFVQPTAVPRLFLLASGQAQLATSDAFYSDRMTDLVASFREQFDVILIDTPPILHLADARILGRLSDGVVLVLRAGKVSGKSAVAAEQRLRDDGIPVIGAILNDWNPKKNGYGVYPDEKSVYSYFAA
jgi:capsular exopolysaccharide synthesis family protein